MLEKEEWVSFRKYILMYCTSSSDNYKLLSHFFSMRNKLTECTDLEDLKRPLFVHMTDKNFSNLMSKIFLWFEEWLVWYEQKKDRNASDIQLVKIYNRNGVFSLADKTYRRVEKSLTKKNLLDLRKNRDWYLLHHYHYFSDNQVKYRRGEEILASLVDYFLIQFKEMASIYAVELYNWGSIQKHDFSKEIKLISQIAALLDDTSTSDVIHLIVKMVSTQDKEAFLKLGAVIYSNKIDPDSELFVIASMYLISYSLKLWSNKVIDDPQHVLNAYDFGIESGVLFRTGKIPFVRFIKIVTTLGHIKTSDKMYAFIDKWRHLVIEENQEAIQAMGYAQLKFFEEKYDEIIPLLLGKKYNTQWGKIYFGALELVSLYYDRKKNYTLLLNRINNFKRALRTFGIKRSETEYRSVLNFVKVMDLLVRRDFIKVTIKIEDYMPIIYNHWVTKEIKAGQN